MILAHALDHYETLTCSCCGYPVKIAHDPEYAHLWSVKSVTCYAGVVWDEHKATQQKGRSQPGEMFYVAFDEDEDRSAPDRFDPEKAAEIHADLIARFSNDTQEG